MITDSRDPMLAHSVYFSLVDRSESAVAAFLAECKKYLTDHPGAVFFAVGTLVEDLDRPLNDRDFDIALHVVFEDRAAHDAYQEAPRHLEFLERNRSKWATARVFDAYVPR